MDRAILGSCRIGCFRLGVKRPDYDKLLAKVERTLPTKAPPDPAIWGTARWGYFRWTVKHGLFEQVKKKVEKSV